MGKSFRRVCHLSILEKSMYDVAKHTKYNYRVSLCPQKTLDQNGDGQNLWKKPSRYGEAPHEESLNCFFATILHGFRGMVNTNEWTLKPPHSTGRNTGLL